MFDEFKFAEIRLGYFKQGSDLGKCISECGDLVAGLKLHKSNMESVADHLGKIAKIINNYSVSLVKINADTHHIGISGPAEMIDELVKDDLAYVFDIEGQ